MLMRFAIRLFTFVFFFLAASVARSAETRRVDGGDLILTGTAIHANAQTAAYLAEMDALNRVAAECGVIPKGTTIWDKHTRKVDGQFTSTVDAGLPITDCQATARLKPAEQKASAQPQLTAEHEKYLQLRQSDVSGKALRTFLSSKFGEVLKQGKETDKRVSALEERVETLKATPPAQIQVIKQTEVIIREAGAPETAKSCYAELKLWNDQQVQRRIAGYAGALDQEEFTDIHMNKTAHCMNVARRENGGVLPVRDPAKVTAEEQCWKDEKAWLDHEAELREKHSPKALSDEVRHDMNWAKTQECNRIRRASRQ